MAAGTAEAGGIARVFGKFPRRSREVSPASRERVSRYQGLLRKLLSSGRATPRKKRTADATIRIWQFYRQPAMIDAQTARSARRAAMQFGYFTLSDNNYADNRRGANQFVADILDEAVYAEEVGLHSAWIGEHHFSTLGVLSCPDLVLAQVAARTSRIRLAPAVTVLPLHHPIRVAEQWATLDLLVGRAGRFRRRARLRPARISAVRRLLRGQPGDLRGGDGDRPPVVVRTRRRCRITEGITGSTMSRSPRARCSGRSRPMSPRSRGRRSSSPPGSAAA